MESTFTPAFAASVTALMIAIVIAIWSTISLRKPKARNRPPQIDSQFAARYYAAYIGETLRLAGYRDVRIPAERLLDGGEALQLALNAEGLLLLSIVNRLSGDAGLASEPVEKPVDQDWILFLKNRPGSFEEARRKADGSKQREQLWKLALELLKKINPIIQRVAGSWTEGQVLPK